MGLTEFSIRGGGIEVFVSSSPEYKIHPGSLHIAARNFRVARHLITILKRDFLEEDLWSAWLSAVQFSVCPSSVIHGSSFIPMLATHLRNFSLSRSSLSNKT